ATLPRPPPRRPHPAAAREAVAVTAEGDTHRGVGRARRGGPLQGASGNRGQVMASPVEDLVKRLGSADFNARALALAELVQRGRDATAALTRALENPDDRLRAQAAQGLAEIADPDSAETFAQLLNDSNGEVRARGA